jgi:hypothetical protein
MFYVFSYLPFLSRREEAHKISQPEDFDDGKPQPTTLRLRCTPFTNQITPPPSSVGQFLLVVTAVIISS